MEIQKQSIGQRVVGVVVRVVLFSAVLAGIAWLIGLEANLGSGNDTLYSEDSLTEYLQIGCMGLLIAVCMVWGSRDKAQQPVAVLLAGFALIALIREMDSFLDHNVFDGAWQVLALISVATVLTMTWRYRNALPGALDVFLNHWTFGIVLSGFLTTFVFSRMFGRKVFWKAVMSEHYIRSVKNVAEEGVELLGYALILIGSLDYIYGRLRLKNRHDHSGMPE